MIAAYIDQIIMFSVGIYASLVGFRVVAPPSKDPAQAQVWLSKFGIFFRVGGPLMIGIAIVLAAAQFFGIAG